MVALDELQGHWRAERKASALPVLSLLSDPSISHNSRHVFFTPATRIDINTKVALAVHRIHPTRLSLLEFLDFCSFYVRNSSTPPD